MHHEPVGRRSLSFSCWLVVEDPVRTRPVEMVVPLVRVDLKPHVALFLRAGVRVEGLGEHSVVPVYQYHLVVPILR